MAHDPDIDLKDPLLPSLLSPLSTVTATLNNGPSNQGNVRQGAFQPQASRQLSAAQEYVTQRKKATRLPRLRPLLLNQQLSRTAAPPTRFLSSLETVATMRINCFRASHDKTDQDFEPPARSPSKKHVRRSASGQSAASRCSTASNASILKLAPCKGVGDPRIEAAMMAVPPEPRPSKCMRLSRPKHYSDVVNAMKESKGCRDWKNFPVFFDLEVDMSKSAEDYARAVRGRTLEYEKTGCRPDLLSSSEESMFLEGVDMIG